MSQGTLYSGPYARSILPEGLVKFLNLDITIAEKDAAYTKAFPLAKFPAFVGPKGYKLTEAIAVNLHLISLSGDKTLLGKDDATFHQIIRYMSLTTSELLPQIANAFKPVVGAVPFNKKNVVEANAAVDKIVALFETRLSEYTFLASERLTLADLFLASTAVRGFQYLWGAEWRKAHPAFVRWYTTVIQHPALASIKDIEFIAKPAEFTPPKKEKKEQAPKAEKPAAAAKAPAASEPAPEEPKKPKHPLELLGKSTKFNLDEWKRTYSNEETREVAIPWFWEHYDPSEWSLWRFDYKYNDELTLTFMSNNLLGGFFNRLSGSTKFMFGSGLVYGENNNNGIVGAFLIRGQEHEPAFDVAPDWESYEFKKLDASKPEDKEFVNDCFAWDKPVVINGESREVADGKVFK